MRKYSLPLVALLVLLVAWPTSASGRDLYFGISANSRTEGTVAQDLALETGVRRLREDIYWAIVEPEDDKWNWTATDQLYETAAEREMSILPIPNSPPCWAVPSETEESDCQRTYPVLDSEYAEFVGKFAQRYGPGGDFWDEHPEFSSDLARPQIEIWNEPYLEQFINEEVDPARYANLYKAAVVAGRESNPSTRYLIESTMDVTTTVSPTGFLPWAESLVSAIPTIGSYIDGIAVHPYPGGHEVDYEPENNTDAAFLNTLYNYLEWKSLGINKPVWITEVGYSSCDDGGDDCVPGSTQAEREQIKAEWLDELLAELGKEKYGFVHAVYLYSLKQYTAATKPDAKGPNWFGIYSHPEASALPAWEAFSSNVAAFNGTPLPNSTITGFTKSGNGGSLMFTVDDATASVECRLDSAPWELCVSPKKYSSGLKGSHTFEVRAKNAEGSELSPASLSW